MGLADAGLFCWDENLTASLKFSLESYHLSKIRCLSGLLYLSTLRSHIEAIGGELDVVARLTYAVVKHDQQTG
jgi:hypothetical protein